MAISKEKKQETLKVLNEAIDKSGSMVFVHFHGLSVSANTRLRNNLRAKGINLLVSKKTLLNKAFADSKVEGSLPKLDGEIAVAYGADLIAPAAEVYAFQISKETRDLVKIVGGVFEGKMMNQAEMVSIATIPPTPVLRGMFVNVLNSPIQSFVTVLDRIAQTKTA